MARQFVAIAALAALTVIAPSQAQQGSSVRPNQGFVPNAETALKVGEAVLIPVYGEQQILAERPFKATLQGNVWVVEGSLHWRDPPARHVRAVRRW